MNKYNDIYNYVHPIKVSEQINSHQNGAILMPWCDGYKSPYEAGVTFRELIEKFGYEDVANCMRSGRIYAGVTKLKGDDRFDPDLVSEGDVIWANGISLA